MIVGVKTRFGFAWALALAAAGAWAQTYTLKDGAVEVAVDAKGHLTSLKNARTGWDYAGGKPLWRLYFDREGGEKEIQVTAEETAPRIEQTDGRIVLRYDALTARGAPLKMRLTLTVRLENGLVRFGSDLANDEPHTIVRELHYPLVGDCRLPAGDKLLTTDWGGQLFTEPVKRINAVGNSPPYAAPSQFYRQMTLKYPSHTAANCFAFVGSHDPTFQDTWHGLRVYPDASGAFTELETGLYKYPNCIAGRTWACDANVLAPYSGDWHQTAKLYRTWADTWWHHRDAPLWVKQMKGWQRIIFRHQYGETLYRYADLNGRIRDAGASVGVETAFTFGWWQSGMDNGYPDSYWTTDPEQGGDAGWAAALAAYRKNGGRILLYFNGKLIDRESPFYRTDEGRDVCYHDNTGADYTEQYRFKGLGTFTGAYNARTFVVADTRRPAWRKRLLAMADRAIAFGADSVFYDQLGYCEDTANWTQDGAFAVPNTRIMADKAETLKTVHDYLDTKHLPDFAIGTEHFTDVTAQHVDYVHNVTGGCTPEAFPEWGRYTFPEVVLSDREIRDDTDIPRRVNLSVRIGYRNDIEIYRCRGLIDETPTYQRYLAQVNRLRDHFCDPLLLGLFRDTDGIANDNPAVKTGVFVNGKRLAVVATQSAAKEASTRLHVPGYAFVESGQAGDMGVTAVPGSDEAAVRAGRDGLAVLLFVRP
jgi:hypothetical protein